MEQDSQLDMAAATEAMSTMLRSGGTLGDAWGTTEAEREALYQVGSNLYGQGKYSDAFKVFSLLVIQNHLEPRYLFALGGACQMLERYADALQHYLAAAVALLDDPLPAFHAAECLIAMGHVEEAKESLQIALMLCGESHGSLQGRAGALLQSLQTRQ
jgi:type III secretion system low calcium response chaperone LcrH/SycD